MYFFLVLTASMHWLVTKAHPYHCSLSLPLRLTQVPGMITGIYSLASKAAYPVYHQPELLLPFVFMINWKSNSIWDSQTHVFRLITASLALRYIWVLQHLPAGISLKEFVLCMSLHAPGWGGSGHKGLWRVKMIMLSRRCLCPFVSFSHLS